MPITLGQLEYALTYVDPNIERTVFTKTDWLDKFVPQDNRAIGDGVKKIEYNRSTATAEWRLLADYANTVTSPNVYVKKIEYETANFGAKVEYTVMEEEAIDFASSNGMRTVIDTLEEKMRANIEAWKKLKNTTFATGVAGIKCWGMVNHPDLRRYAAPTQITELSDPDDDYRLLCAATNSIPNATQDQEEGTTLILPSRLHQIISQKTLDVDHKMTVLDKYLANNGTVTEVDKSRELEGAGPGGGDLALIYDRSPDKVVGIIVQERKQIGPPQPNGYQFDIFYKGKVAGVHYKRPWSAVVVEFAAA